MVKVKASELTGAALDWAAAKCVALDAGMQSALGRFCSDGWPFEPSTDWSQGGPIIERENITLRPVFHAERSESGADVYRQDGWAAHVEPKAFWVTPRPKAGITPLIAAMRCYVASKLGDTIEVPEELA